MAQTIRRKSSTGVRRQARAAGRKGKVKKAQAGGNALAGWVRARLPFTDEQLHRAFTALILAAAAAFALFLAHISGVTAVVGERLARFAGDAGYEVHWVEVRGTERMNEMRVYERALGQRDRAMPLVDLEELRDSLLELSWVADARVSRQLPDGLVIDIVERVPHAVLQKADGLALIDAEGVALEPISRADAEGMLLIEGMGAQGQVAALDMLLDAAPALRPQVAAAEWVGNRRWNLTFATDQRLALPEGPDQAAAALVSFAQADGVHRLLGGEVVSFDMRNPPRMYLRVPGRADRELPASTSAGEDT